jgi:hypothetical protein
MLQGRSHHGRWSVASHMSRSGRLTARPRRASFRSRNRAMREVVLPYDVDKQHTRRLEDGHAC